MTKCFLVWSDMHGNTTVYRNQMPFWINPWLEDWQISYLKLYLSDYVYMSVRFMIA